jgi:hypothetical protein
MKINPRNFHKRRLSYIPAHFKRMNIKNIGSPFEDILARWIYSNCNGRFGITNTTDWANDQVKAYTTIGFEEPSDMTLFALAGLTQINQ